VDQAEIRAIIEEGMHLRGWISNAYAQVEYLLGDLIMQCRAYPIYAEQTATFTHSATKRVAKVRTMLNLGGPLAPYAARVGEMLDAFSNNHDTRNLLAHGFCEFHHTPSGDAGLVFSRFERGGGAENQNEDSLVVRTFRLVDLQYHEAQLTHQSKAALELFTEMYAELGWVRGHLAVIAQGVGGA